MLVYSLTHQCAAGIATYRESVHQDRCRLTCLPAATQIYAEVRQPHFEMIVGVVDSATPNAYAMARYETAHFRSSCRQLQHFIRSRLASLQLATPTLHERKSVIRVI